MSYDDMPCPHCGNDPDIDDCHAEGCPTLGTCAQCAPSLPKPWHAEAGWASGGFTSEGWVKHMDANHPGWRSLS